jgi:putative ABC transport system permease protein
MIRNYVLVAIRNLTRSKFFSAINIFGLAVSMSICMAIIMLVADQMLYDRYNTNRSQIYRVNTYGVDNNGVQRGSMESSTSPMPLKAELLENYTGIEKAVRLKRGFGNSWLDLENNNVNVPVKGFWADPEVFDFFQYEMEYGDANTALTKPYSVVLTRQAAKKLFKEENPIGLTLIVGDLGTYTVTGVLKETRNKSHIVFEALASMSTIKSLTAEGKFTNDMDSWEDFWHGWTYIQVQPEKSADDIQQHLDKIYKKHIASITNPDAYKAKFKLQSITDITPGPFTNNPIGPSLPWVFVYFLGGLAAVIMLTSCFNFTNLSIARSLKRAKEIGVRKVTGAARWQIFTQFLSESIVIAACSLIVALFILVALKPLMLQLNFAKIFMWDLAANYAVYAVFAVFTLAVGILAGLFPAIVLSGFQPVKVLKSMNNVKLFSRMGLRKTLLVTQFTMSLIFILTVIIMYNQLDLFLTKDYGFNMKENISVKLNNTASAPLKAELLKFNNIKNVSAASHTPAAGITFGSGFKKDLADKEWLNSNYFIVDEDYLDNMEVKLVAGEFFKAENADGNKNFIVINETALKTFNYKTISEALGQQLIMQNDSSTKQIIGVVQDYNHSMLMEELEPMILTYDPERVSALQVRYTGSYENAVQSIEKAWAAVNPALKVDHKLLEEEIKFMYNTVFGDVVNVLGVISFLAILISCLGLLGMATYTIETRMKEISIRKVLGSTDNALIILLSRGFLTMLVIAVLIGVPAAWLINNLWLEHMAYHISVSVGMITLSIAILFVLGLLTIGSQTLRAAFTNPVDNLKSE